jgi:hypothetical protein
MGVGGLTSSPPNPSTDARSDSPAVVPVARPTDSATDPPAGESSDSPTDTPVAERASAPTDEPKGQPAGRTDGRVHKRPTSHRAAATEEHAPDREAYAEAVDRTARTKPEGGLIGFRASADERRRLRTFLFEVESQIGRVPQQELLRLGLNMLMLDWEQRGERSYAAQLYPRLQRR